MPATEHLITTPDGRTLDVVESGDPRGQAIVVHHGTPGSKLLYDAWCADAERREARLISYCRPGYARSTRRRGRTVGNCVTDVTAILDALGIERCVTWGVSGGGPHALACGALLPDRVAAVASLASPAPCDARGLDWLAGMGADNVAELGAAVAGEEPLREVIEAQLPALKGAAPAATVDNMASLLSGPDQDVFTGEFAGFLVTYMRGGLADSADGWIDDDLAFVSEWGFDPAEITVPLQIWQGRHDLMVPPAHGRWLMEHSRAADAHLSEDDGHLTLLVNRVADVHEWLLAQLSSAQRVR